MSSQISAAIAIRRRSAAIALFHQTHLEDVLERQFPTESTKAEASLASFIYRTLNEFPIEQASLEDASGPSERVVRFYGQAEGLLRNEAVPIEKIDEQELYESFAVPPLKRRDQLRNIIRTILPALDSPEVGLAALDAAALGLYCEIERLFRINSPTQ